MPTLIQTAVLNPAQAILVRLANLLPSIIWALLLLGIGIIIAKLLRTAAEKVLRLGKLDIWSEKAGLGTLLERLGLGHSVVKIIGVLIWWFVFLIFFMAAADSLNLTIVSEMLNRFIMFMPKLISAVFVLAVGVYISSVIKEIVHNACVANHIKGGATLAKLSRGIVIAFSVFMALEQIGIAYTVTTSTLQIILGSIGLAAALAFGLGSKDVAGDIIRNLVRKE
jgi:hypothetical protein